MPPISELLNLTLAQAIAWVVSTGVFAVVSYALAWFPSLGENTRKILYAVLSAMLIAGVTAIAQFIPDQYLLMKIIDVVVALIASISGLYAANRFAEYKAVCHADEMNMAIEALEANPK